MKKLLYVLFAIIAIVACSKSDDVGGGNNNNNETPKQPEITLDATASNFTTDGGQSEITFTSSAAWTAEVINTRADAWCTVNPTSGAAGDAKITVTTTANDTPDDRTASIIIKAGTASKTINVSQKQKDALTVTSSKFEVSAEGGEILIEVKANIDFEYAIEESAADWVEYKATRALKTSNLVFEVKENDDIDKREAKISITSGEFSEVVTIYQAGAEPTIVISKNEYVVSSDSETIAVDVTSNVDVAVEIPSDVDWITENATRATSTNTYRFDILPNDNYDQREAEIKFTNKANGLSETVKIVQAQKDAIVLAKSEYEFNINGGALDLEVQTNVDLNVTISDDAHSWIHQIETRGLETKTLYFNIDACDENISRSATITITGGNATQEISVKQKLVIPSNQIWYTSINDEVVTPYKKDVFGSNIVSNVYLNGKGVITFDNSITSIGNNAFQDCSLLTSITIPETVTSFGDYAFSDCSSLTSITIPNGVTSITGIAFQGCSSLTSFYGENASADNRCWIEDGVLKAFAPSGLNSYTIPEEVISIGVWAFLDCSSLMCITIPKGVKIIEMNAFYDCSSLISVNISEGVTEIGPGAFYACSAITSINIPKGVKSIGGSAFAHCSSLTSITIPEGVTSIGTYTFYGCSSLTSITIPEGVTSIKRGAFAGCSSLTSITIPEGVTSIDESAFEECSDLTSITIPEGVTSIGDWAFSMCSSLTSITIPKGVTSIKNRTFEGCSSLTNITIPEGVTSIGYIAFYGCSSLTSITIPEGVTSIGENAFAGCSSLTSVNIPKGVTNINRNTFSSCSSLTSITIPEGVTSIGSQAFAGCSSLKNINIPKEVTSIGYSAFHDCSSLTSIVIPEGVTEIPVCTFQNCTSLTSITIPNGLTTIGALVFAGCTSLTSINIPKEVTFIGAESFCDCTSLSEVYCMPTTPPKMHYDGAVLFRNNAPNCKIYVPTDSVDTYKAANGWKDYAKDIVGYDFSN